MVTSKRAKGFIALEPANSEPSLDIIESLIDSIEPSFDSTNISLNYSNRCFYSIESSIDSNNRRVDRSESVFDGLCYLERVRDGYLFGARRAA